jgi:hypothetical protein
VVEEPESTVGLGMSGDVRVRIGETSARDVWSVRTTETGRRVFMAAEATRLARRLLRAEASVPSAELAIEIPGVAGKPVALAFPLAGLRANVDKIIKRCDDWDLKETE